MKTSVLSIVAVTVALLAPIDVTAKPGDVYIYPANGQSTEQLERDRYECYVWASRETGFDPSTDSQPDPRLVRVPVGENPKQGATAVGTIVGAIAGAAIADKHEGAAVGAVIGTIIGAAVESEGAEQARQEAQQTAEQIAAERQQAADRNSDYRRAFSACLEGRGYVVR